MEWFIKANLNLAVLFIVYKLIIRFSGRHMLARLYLLATPLVSVLLPLLIVNTSFQTTIPSVYLEPFTVSAIVEQQQKSGILSFAMVYQIYLLGVIISLMVTGISVVKLLLNRSSIKTAYSFFRHIYIPEASSEKTTMMLLHEEAHVKQWHSLDTIWYAFVRAIFWINPVVYRLFGCLKEEHEYSADAYAVKRIGDLSSYCDLLLDETFGVSNISQLAHSFHSPISLLNRIKMITQTQPQSVAWWKRIVTLPLLGVLFLISVLGTNTFAQKIEGKVYDGKDMPEKMPEFPGGQEAMMKFLQDNIQYPKDAKEEKVSGRVVLQFVVTNKGKLADITVLKKEVDARLQAESLRVMGLMPDWKPGMQNGKAVNVKFTLPIAFNLK